jgi:hypothetical protein
MERLRAGIGRASLERGDMLVVLPDEGLVVTDVIVVHPAANRFLQRAAHASGAAASAWDATNSRKYGGGGQVAGGSLVHVVLSASGKAGNAVFLRTLADAVASSATTGSYVPTSSFVMGALHEFSVALVKGNEVVYCEALHMYATASGTAARAGATVDPD